MGSGSWGLLKAKCLLTLQMDEVAPKNHYKLGELSIGGIISETQTFFQLIKTDTINTGITVLCLIHTGIMKSPAGKVLVTTVLWDLSTYLKGQGVLYRNIHSIFSFVLKSNQVMKYGGNNQFEAFMRSFAEKSFMCSWPQNAFTVKLHPFLENTEFYNRSIAGVYLDENGVLAVDLNIVNWLLHKREIHRIKIGSLEKQESLDFKFMLYSKGVKQMDKLNQ
ncbi:hypothetical protein E2320_014355, partial [Naja naja]